MPATAERTRARTLVTLAVGGVIVAVGAAIIRYDLQGLAVDRGAVRHWLAGGELYDYRDPSSLLGTALPPPAAIGLAPAAYLPLWVAAWLLALAGAAALVLAAVALAGPVARRYGRPRLPWVAAATAVMLVAEPVRAALGLGHLDLLLFGLLTADIVALRRGAWARSRAAWWPGRPASAPPSGRRSVQDLLRHGWETGAWAGVGTGIATALAVCPLLFLGYLAVTRQWRAALTGAATAAALALAALVISPAESLAWSAQVLFRLDRTGGVAGPDNHSLAGVLARLYDSATTPLLLWLSFALLLVAVGLSRARAAHADGDEITAYTLVGLTVAIVGPLSPAHQLIWALPAILILVDAGLRHRTTARLGRRTPSLRDGLAPDLVNRSTGPLLRLIDRPPRARPAGPRPHPAIPGSRTTTPRPRATGASRWRRRRGLRQTRLPGALHFGSAAATLAVFTVDIPGESRALALILLICALPWRPGAAPAYPVDRWAKARLLRRIPPARKPVRGS